MVRREEVPDWITLDDDEEPVGFLSHDEGTAILALLLADWIAPLLCDSAPTVIDDSLTPDDY